MRHHPLRSPPARTSLGASKPTRYDLRGNTVTMTIAPAAPSLVQLLETYRARRLPYRAPTARRVRMAWLVAGLSRP